MRDAARRGMDPVVLAIFVVSLVLRLVLASTEGYIHDEDHNAIPLARTISATPGHVHLPLRGENHGALPAYVVKVSSVVFGASPMGYRGLHLLLGLLTLALITRMAWEWYGPIATRWTAALLALNEYGLMVGTRATAHAPFHVCIAAAMYGFSRFVRDGRPAGLYAAGAALGLAFYAKEHAALLVPIFMAAAVFLPTPRRRAALLHGVGALAVFAALIAPDTYWNLRMHPEDSIVTYGDQPALQATYSSHLSRIGGLGLSPYPAMFYARSWTSSLVEAVTGTAPRDETREYASMNPVLGLTMLTATGIAIAGFRRHAIQPMLLLMFWGVFGFFTLIKRGNPPGRLDPASWIWVEATMFPAALLTGEAMARLTGAWRWAAGAVVTAALAYACSVPLLRLAGAAVAAKEWIASETLHALGLMALGMVDSVRAHPLRTLAITALLGILAGFLVGFLAGRLARGRRGA